MPKKVMAGCVISLYGKHPGWGANHVDKLPGWLFHLGGRYNRKLDSSITHLVVSQKRWDEEPKPAIVQDAIDQVAKGRDLKIVNFEWLEDCLNGQSKKREASYEYLKLEEEAAKEQAKKKKVADKAEKAAAKSQPGLMLDMFEESTDKFVDPIQKEKLDRQLQREKEERRQKEIEEKEEKVRRRKEQAKVFARGAKKGRGQLLSDNFHIYSDTTGFKYDVLVTKIEIRQNRNERWALTLQLYESNDEPFRYAMNAQFSGTNLATANNVVAAHDSTYLVAMHAFKSDFERLTGVDWDERISTRVKRLRQHKIDQGIGTGSPAPGSVRGAPVSESAVREVTFEQRNFEYQPPGYGPKGEVTSGERDRLKALGLDVVDGTRAKGARVPAVVPVDREVQMDTRSAVEDWMKGADLSAVEAELPVVPEPEENEVDFERMMAEHGIRYAFERTSGLQETQGETQQTEQADVANGDETQLSQNGEADVPPQEGREPAFNGSVAEGDAGATQLDTQADTQPNTQIDTQLGSTRVNTLVDTQLDTQLDTQPNTQDQPAATDVNGNASAEQSSGGLNMDDPDFGNLDLSNIDWDSFGNNAGDSSWLDAEMAKWNDTEPQPIDEGSSMQPELPSFNTNRDETSFQHGTQEISETQIAERAGGEFLERLKRKDSVETPLTPPATSKKPAAIDKNASKSSSFAAIAGGDVEGASAAKVPNGVLGGLNFGSSILGKRKARAPESGSDTEGGGKKSKVHASPEA